jgi:hypothetical protein
VRDKQLQWTVLDTHRRSCLKQEKYGSLQELASRC